jgi:hypothetical protein
MPTEPEKLVAEARKSIKIRLLTDLPVHPKHDARAGNVYDAEFVPESGRGKVRYWITAASGERVGVMNREAEVLTEGDDEE